MASFSYSDDEDQKRGAQKDKLNAPQAPSGPTPTFAELQRRGMPRPPPMMGAASQALYGAAGQPTPTTFQDRVTGGGSGAQLPPPGGQNNFQDMYQGLRGHLSGSQEPYRGKLGPVNMGPTKPLEGYYKPTGQLDQGNLEGYLYDMLANPTNTLTYKNIMKNVGAEVDTDASRRGVFYSTIPVGAYSKAGSDLAANLQNQAYGQLQGYNQNYEQLLMSLLGAT